MSSLSPPKDAVSVIAQEFIVDEPCALSVDVPGALVQLRPGPDQGRVEVDISVAGCPAEEADDIIDRLAFGTKQMKDTVQVHSDGYRSQAEWWRWIRTLDVTIHVDLRLPSRIEADLDVPGGEIDIANLEGHFDLQNMGGVCHAEHIEGTLDIRGESSDISVTDFSGDQIIARVAAGSLALEDAEAETITLRSISAPVTFTNVEGAANITANSTSVDLDGHEGPCVVRCQGGPVSYTGAPTSETELTSVGSTLNVELPSGHDADLFLTGDHLALDESFSFDGEITDHEIEGTLNDGGPALTLRAIGGSVDCHPS